MARPRAATYDDQHTQILSAAAALFARRGYTATTMNEVAAACGVSKATLYHYFSDKSGLLEHIARAHVERLEALVREVPASRNPGDRLRELIERFMHAYAGARDEHRVLTEDVKFLPDAARKTVLAGERRVVAAFAGAIAEARPALDAQLRKPLAMLLFGMINWTFTWLRPEGRLTHDALAPIVADLFFGGLGAVRGAAPAAPAALRRRGPSVP
ncbi:MAG TPA: TetR/AcrR family transcriptional regulator [Rubrivivax sp.]